jgi:Protein of unknown function (DUF3467)
MSKSQEPKKEVQLRDTRDQFVSYSNLASVTMTPEEAILTFGMRDVDSPNTGTTIAKLYISPAHAKRLAAALARIVQGYEETFGEIAADPIDRLSKGARQKLGIPETKEE